MDPPIFANLKIMFPLDTLSAKDLLALHAASPQCEHLTVTVSAVSASIPNPSDAISTTTTSLLPPFPRLKHLHLIVPDHDPFHSLLAFRLALQSATLPLLTHLTIANLSFPGLLALRCGAFTSFSDKGWTGADVWHNLTELDVKLRGWWDGEEDDDEYGHEGEVETAVEKAKRQKEYWRSCTRILHDWLHSFAANNAHLRTFKFEWLSSSSSSSNSCNGNSNEGPNPFLLDEISSHDGKKQWFSAPRITWASNTLTAVWLGNVVVDGKDVGKLKERMKGLERVLVVPECLDGGLGGRKVVAGGSGKVWVELDVEGDRVGEWGHVVDGGRRVGGEIEGGGEGTGEGGEKVLMMRGSYCEGGGGGGGDRASMVLPFVLNLSPDDETFS